MPATGGVTLHPISFARAAATSLVLWRLRAVWLARIVIRLAYYCYVK